MLIVLHLFFLIRPGPMQMMWPSTTSALDTVGWVTTSSQMMLPRKPATFAHVLSMACSCPRSSSVIGTCSIASTLRVKCMLRPEPFLAVRSMCRIVLVSMILGYWSSWPRLMVNFFCVTAQPGPPEIACSVIPKRITERCWSFSTPMVLGSWELWDCSTSRDLPGIVLFVASPCSNKSRSHCKPGQSPEMSRSSERLPSTPRGSLRPFCGPGLGKFWFFQMATTVSWWSWAIGNVSRSSLSAPSGRCLVWPASQLWAWWIWWIREEPCKRSKVKRKDLWKLLDVAVAVSDFMRLLKPDSATWWLTNRNYLRSRHQTFHPLRMAIQLAMTSISDLVPAPCPLVML